MVPPSSLAEEPEELNTASSWGPRPLGVCHSFSLPQTLASMIAACRSPNLNYTQPASAPGFRTAWLPGWGEEMGAVDYRPAGEPLGFLAFVLILSQKHWAKQWGEDRE